jgi:hypothetical protein
MKTYAVVAAVTAVVLLGAWALVPAARADGCRKVHAELVEQRSTAGCLDPAKVCFLGQVDGNHGLRGTTHFQAAEARFALVGSPGWLSYAGFFHYTLEKGTLVVRETGVSGPERVAASQRIVEGTGAFTGATGSLFVTGLKLDGGARLVTEITGELCLP